MSRIHHVMTVEAWAAFQADGESRASTRDRSIEEEGFVHCSYPEQLEGTLAKHYGDLAEVVVLTLDTDRIEAEVIDEPAADGTAFPHVYGPLPLRAVIEADTRPPVAG